MCAACVLILFCTFLSTDFGEPQASIQHKLNLQECDSGGLGPRTLRCRLAQGRWQQVRESSP